MDKKSILALVLIAIIILLLPYYQELFIGKAPVQPIAKSDTVQTIENKQPVPEKKAPVQPVVKKETATEKELEQPAIHAAIEEDSSEYVYEIDTDIYHAVISNKGGGTLKSFLLKKYLKYDSSTVDLISTINQNGLTLAFQDQDGEFVNTDNYLFTGNKEAGSFKLTAADQFKIEFSLKVQGQIVRKTFIFYGDRYHFDMVVYFSDPANMLLNRQYEIGWKGGMPSTEKNVIDDFSYNQAYVYMGEELENYDVTDAGKKETVTMTGKADWLAVRTKYFLTSLFPIGQNHTEGIYFSGRGKQHKNPDYIERIYDVGFNARYESATGDSMRIYLGPLDYNELEKYNNHIDKLIMNNGWYERVFRFFSLLVLQILELLHAVIPNYGIVIIVFSILIKLIVFPLTHKSYSSMKEMQRINPLVAELKEKYKGDPQRLNKETMKLYKEHGVNPLGGCLPTLLQMPLLISLYIVFRSTIQLRGAMFIPGWIPDLSVPDTIFTLPFSLPMYGNQFNVLPILMAITMIFQSKMTMQDPKQKAMVYLMPLFMLLIFNQFSSGLNLYYTLFNLFTIIQQKYITPSPKPVPATGKAVKKQKKKK